MYVFRNDVIYVRALMLPCAVVQLGQQHMLLFLHFSLYDRDHYTYVLFSVARFRESRPPLFYFILFVKGENFIDA